MQIEARAGKELVYVAVDGNRVYEDATTDDSKRGLHIIVLNEHTGVVMATKVLDTYAFNMDGEIVLFLNMLQDGRIIILVTKVRFDQF